MVARNDPSRSSAPSEGEEAYERGDTSIEHQTDRGGAPDREPAPPATEAPPPDPASEMEEPEEPAPR